MTLEPEYDNILSQRFQTGLEALRTTSSEVISMREINYDKTTKMKRGFPKITKKGAINRNGEMTPFVYKGRLMRMELSDPWHYTRQNGGKCSDTVAYIRDVGTNEILSSTGEGCYFHAAYVEDDVVYITGVVMNRRDTIRMFRSEDLIHWESWDLFSNPGWVYFNTGLTKGPDGYVLLMECNGPADIVGVPFTHFFATSPDLKQWTLMDYDKSSSKEYYTGGPWFRYSNGYYYMIVCIQLPCARYTNYIYRTSDFEAWEVGFYNPLLMPDEDDRLIAASLTETDSAFLEEVRTGFISSNSDIDMCDWNGKTYINYLAGNQLGFYYMCEAEYDGTVDEFLAANFE